MLIALIGESCTGKSTLAEALRARVPAEIFSGKDYLRMKKSPQEAETAFRQLLCERAADADLTVYVVSEREQAALLPEGCFRVLVKAELPVIQARFAKRTGGKLPPPVAAMLERKHGMFDASPCDLTIDGGDGAPEAAAARILTACGRTEA